MMKIVYGLLFSAILAQVRAHYCSHLAAAIGRKVENIVHPNPHKNQVIEYVDFTTNDPKKSREMFLSWVTLDPGFDAEEFPQFCSAATFGTACRDVFFVRKIINPEALFKDGKPNVEIRTNFYAKNYDTQAYTAYTMDIELADEKREYYIFKTKPNTLKAFGETGEEKKIVRLEIPKKIENVISFEFALHYGVRDFNVYITCDARYAWVSLAPGVLVGNVRKAVEEILSKLKEKMLEETREKVKEVVNQYNNNTVQRFSQQIEVLDDN